MSLMSFCHGTRYIQKFGHCVAKLSLPVTLVGFGIVEDGPGTFSGFPFSSEFSFCVDVWVDAMLS